MENMEVISELKNIFKTSSEHVRNFKYIGMELNQKEDCTIIVSQNDYIDELVLITLDETRTKCAKDEPVNDQGSICPPP